jgi:hypothetical protein
LGRKERRRIEWLLAGGCKLKGNKKENKGRGPVCLGEGDVEQILKRLQRCLQIEIRYGKF